MGIPWTLADKRRLDNIDRAANTIEPHVAEFIASHRDARHGPKVARERARKRAALPKPVNRKMTPKQFVKAWSEGGIGPVPIHILS